MVRRPRPPRRSKRARAAALAAVLAALGAWKFYPQDKGYAAGAWVSDYKWFRGRLTDVYANLEFAAEKGSPDLAELDRTTHRAVIYAPTDKEAERVLRRAVRAFDDGHMALLPRDAAPLDPPPDDVPLSRHTSPEAACSSLHYGAERDAGFPFRFEGLPGFRALPGANDFAAGVLDFEGRRFGLLRIDSFDTKDFRSACELEWRLLRSTLDGTCEGRCRSELGTRVAGHLLREIGARILELERADARILVVDVTGNSGGMAWYGRAAELLTPNPLPPFRAAHVKSERTVGWLDHERQVIFNYLARRNPSPDQRAALEQALCRLDDLIAEAGQPCDPSPLWEGRPRQMGCSRLTTRELYGSGVLARYDAAPLPREVQAGAFFDGIYPRVTPLWRGPLAVLVDEDTASAAEFFAALLKFRAGATLVGRHTASTGSGWMFHRRPWRLPLSGLQLYVPDTVEYWPDGANAREGLDPDVPVPWRPGEDPGLKAKRLLKAFRSLDFPDVGQPSNPARDRM